MATEPVRTALARLVEVLAPCPCCTSPSVEKRLAAAREALAAAPPEDEEGT